MRAVCAIGLLPLAMAIVGCKGVVPPPPPPSAESICAAESNPAGTGNLFFVGTPQTNLQKDANLTNAGYTGFCYFTNENLGAVGWAGTTSNGGAFPVTTQQNAIAQCDALTASGQSCTVHSASRNVP